MWLVYEEVSSAEDEFFANKYRVSTKEQAIYLADTLNAITPETYSITELKPLTPEEIEEAIQYEREMNE